MGKKRFSLDDIHKQIDTTLGIETGEKGSPVLQRLREAIRKRRLPRV